MNRRRRTNQRAGTKKQQNYTDQNSFITSYWPSASRCSAAYQLASGHKVQLGSCCCAGPVRDAQGHRYSTFPQCGLMNKCLELDKGVPVKQITLHNL